MENKEVEYKFLVYGCLKNLRSFSSNSLSTVKQYYLDLKHPLTEYLLDKYLNKSILGIEECRIRTRNSWSVPIITAKSRYLNDDDDGILS